MNKNLYLKRQIKMNGGNKIYRNRNFLVQIKYSPIYSTFRSLNYVQIRLLLYIKTLKLNAFHIFPNVYNIPFTFIKSFYFKSM